VYQAIKEKLPTTFECTKELLKLLKEAILEVLKDFVSLIEKNEIIVTMQAQKTNVTVTNQTSKPSTFLSLKHENQVHNGVAFGTAGLCQ
jgi:hypothetical protein